MALSNASLFLFNYVITSLNNTISFGTNSGEAPPNNRTATIALGNYSLTSLLSEIASAFSAADPLNIYSVTANRSIAGGLQNRITISTSGSYLSIYFGTGAGNNPATLLGFATSNLTGLTSYTGTASSGTILIPNQIGFNFLSPDKMVKNFGSVNVSASGLKEAIIFSIQSFWQVQFKYIPGATYSSQWASLIQWLIQQNEIDFTPDITEPTVFYTGTLDDPNQGLQVDITEMLPDFPNEYQTPLMKFRVRNQS